MGTRTIAMLITIGFSVIGVLGDYFLKLASAREQPLRTGWFYLGFALYASTAFGWVFVMKHLKLATISVLYSVSLVLSLYIKGSMRLAGPLTDNAGGAVLLDVSDEAEAK